MWNTIARFARTTLLLAIPLLLLAACGGEDEDEPSGSTTGTDTTSSTTAITPTQPQTLATPAPIPAPVAAAIRQAAEAAGVTVDEVELRQYQMTEWPSAALGCPQEGQMYSQVVTRGFVVQVRVNGEVVRYHTDMDATAIRCDNPSQ